MSNRAWAILRCRDVETDDTLFEQLKAGKVATTAIDDAVRRLLLEKSDLGLFENAPVDPDRAEATSDAAGSRGLALEAARKAIVLLRNRGGLLPPRADRARRVAAIGPHSAEVMLGGYSGVPRHPVSLLEGIRRRLDPDATVRHAEGARITEDSTLTPGPQPLVGGTRSRARRSRPPGSRRTAWPRCPSRWPTPGDEAATRSSSSTSATR